MRHVFNICQFRHLQRRSCPVTFFSPLRTFSLSTPPPFIPPPIPARPNITPTNLEKRSSVESPLSFFQRIRFVLTPRSREHRTNVPLFRPLERAINTRWAKLRLWCVTRSKQQWRVYFVSWSIIGASLYYYTRPVLPYGYEYQPETMQQRKYQSALLSHPYSDWTR